MAVTRERHRCVGCGGEPPPQAGDYTLISAQFGWRLIRKTDTAGRLELEWRCPQCWERYKELNGVPASQPRRPQKP